LFLNHPCNYPQSFLFLIPQLFVSMNAWCELKSGWVAGNFLWNDHITQFAFSESWLKWVSVRCSHLNWYIHLFFFFPFVFFLNTNMHPCIHIKIDEKIFYLNTKIKTVEILVCYVFCDVTWIGYVGA
jgi:hypothetical protein